MVRLARRLAGFQEQIRSSSEGDGARFGVGCHLATLHFKGYLVGNQSLESCVRGARGAMRWVPVPADIGAAIVGMVAEEAVDATPRKRGDDTHTPAHVIDTGGMLVDYYMTELGRRMPAFEVANRQLVSMGFLEKPVAVSTLKKWHQRHRERLGQDPLPVGRPPRPK